MKKFLLSISSIMLIIASVIGLVACSLDEINYEGKEVGALMPDSVKPKYSINSQMSAVEMMAIAQKNFDEIKYAGSVQISEVLTNAGIKVKQSVTSRRVKENSLVYKDSYSATIDSPAGSLNIQIMEETVVDKGAVRFRTANKIKIEDGEFVAESWKPIKNYPTLADALKVNPDDPTRMYMYIVNESTIVNATKPEYDNKTEQYTFNLQLDPSTSTIDYVPVMQYMLAQQGYKNVPVTFNKLNLEVVMWNNGLIRSIKFDEDYSIKLMGFIEGNVTSGGVNYFTYNSKELQINDCIKF